VCCGAVFATPKMSNSVNTLKTNNYIVTNSRVLFHDGTLLHSKCQYTTVKHSRQLLEHTYTSDSHGLGTLTPTPIEFFQRDLLWESSITHSSSCRQKASKHTSGQSIVGLSVRLHATTALRRIVHHQPALAPIIECLHRPRYKLAWIYHNFPTHKHVFLEWSPNPHWFMYHCRIHSNASVLLLCYICFIVASVSLFRASWKRLVYIVAQTCHVTVES
jgi:hypothetical protein